MARKTTHITEHVRDDAPTPPKPSEATAKELFELTQQIKTLSKRAEELKEMFKSGPGARTGETQYGEYVVIVSSNSKSVLDQNTAKEILAQMGKLQEALKAQLQVQCKVERLATPAP